MPFSYDRSIGHYRTERGDIVRWSVVRKEMLKTERGVEASMRVLTDRLREGSISLSSWQAEMKRVIKNLHVSNMMLAVGGRDMMTPATRGATGGHLLREYRALQALALKIQSGDQRLDGTLWRTARHYLRAARKTFYEGTRRRVGGQGFDQEKSVRTAGERSCDSCIHEENRGWVPLGALVPIGDRRCLRNCLCVMYFRNSVSGAEAGPF